MDNWYWYSYTAILSAVMYTGSVQPVRVPKLVHLATVSRKNVLAARRTCTSTSYILHFVMLSSDT